MLPTWVSDNVLIMSESSSLVRDNVHTRKYLPQAVKKIYALMELLLVVIPKGWVDSRYIAVTYFELNQFLNILMCFLVLFFSTLLHQSDKNIVNFVVSSTLVVIFLISEKKKLAGFFQSNHGSIVRHFFNLKSSFIYK